MSLTGEKMKKKFIKKLDIRKESISNLSYDNMNEIRGGTVFQNCSKSCSIFDYCCDTKTNPVEEKAVLEKNLG
jgi:hypothetical protein